jgi:hypothetical protein
MKPAASGTVLFLKNLQKNRWVSIIVLFRILLSRECSLQISTIMRSFISSDIKTAGHEGVGTEDIVAD